METESDPSVGCILGSVSYLASFYGYDKPTVDVTLKYPPPTTVPRSSRTVKYDGRYYIIWSPNSDYVPYYPGTLAPPRDDGRLDLPPADERRWDGQLGPNDPTISPQYYDPTAPWLPLITRDNDDPLFAGDDTSVAWSRVYDMWQTDPDSYEGRLNPRFIATLKREHSIVDDDIQEQKKNPHLRRDVRDAGIFIFSPADVEGLRRIRRYDQAVILVRRAQRALLKKKAWLEMASAWMRVCKSL